jgi:uncharacterized protein YdeI (YjbR/CyaY-like superfamily)
MNSNVDTFIAKSTKWRAELTALRAILLDSELTEDFKWKQPVYTFNGKNVVIISGFKNYCVMSFFKGALLTDKNGILVVPGENTQSARTARFTSLAEITKLTPTLRAYVKEAIANERAGKKVAFKKITEHAIPDELAARFKKQPKLERAFRALAPGCQREYLLYFSSAKLKETRERRIDKYVESILDGKKIGG